jgi:hypothetical protein
VERLQSGFRLTCVPAVGMRAARRAKRRRSPSNDSTGFGSLGIEFRFSEFSSPKQILLPNDDLVRLQLCSSAIKIWAPGPRRAYREIQKMPPWTEPYPCYPTAQVPLQESFAKIAKPRWQSWIPQPICRVGIKTSNFRTLLQSGRRLSLKRLFMLQLRLLSAPEDPYAVATQHTSFCQVPPYSSVIIYVSSQAL